MAQTTPPPYTNITGISRAVMKDNAQETIEGYNGSARPGELVVNLEVDPPTVFIGNNAGALTQLVSGSGGDYSNANVIALGESGWAGNIVPAADATYSLGNVTNQWGELWLAGNTLYINSVPITVSEGNTLVINGEPVLANNSTVNIATTGNITAGFFIGDGSQLTGITAEADTGDITFDATTISAPDESVIVVEARDETGAATARLTLDPDESIAKLESTANDDELFSPNNGYSTAEWTVNQFGDGVLVFSDALDLYNFIDRSSTAWDNGTNRTFSWNNDDQRVEYTGYSWNDGINELTLNVGSENLPPEDPTEVTVLTLDWVNLSRISVDSLDNEEIQIFGRGIGMVVRATEDISIRSGDDMDIRAEDDMDIRAIDRLVLDGGRVRIRSRNSDDTVEITTDYEDEEYTWQFRENGSLRLPALGLIAEGVVTENPTIELTPANPNTESQKLLIKGGFGPEDNHLHLTTGDLGETSIFLGIDDHNVRTTTAGEIEITTPDGEDGTHVWRFAGDGTTYLARNTVSPISYLSTPQNDDNIDLELQVGKDFYINTAEFGDNTRKTWKFDTDGALTFPDDSVQTTAYAGTNGRQMFIDTNRTGDYVANGSADKPFKTFAAAIAAVAELNPTGTVPYTFVLMGCNINEDVDFTPYNFNFITISTACRAVFNNPVTFGNSALKQITIRNVEFGNTFTITGDGTADQLNNVSIYNTSFSGAVNITATNATAFYEAAFFGAVNFTNLSYLYINGAQFNEDWTITADSNGVIPSKGIDPGVAIVFSAIINNLIFVKGGTAVYVFQPHMTRIGRVAGTYTNPAGWTVAAYSTVFRGTWTNDGSWAMRNSSNDNPIANVAPTYNGTIGGNIVVASGNITGGNIITAGNVSAASLQNDGNLVIRSNVAGAARTWTFDAIGDLNLPVGGNISGSGYVTAVRVITDPRPLTNLTPVAGGRAFVSDGNLVAAGNFGVQIGGGGANTVPVWSDGTNWYVG